MRIPLWFAMRRAFREGCREARQLAEQTGSAVNAHLQFPLTVTNRIHALVDEAVARLERSRTFRALAGKYRPALLGLEGATVAHENAAMASARVQEDLNAAEQRRSEDLHRQAEDAAKSDTPPGDNFPSRSAYPYLLLLFVVLELPFAFMFLQVIGADTILTFVIALGISAISPTIGHFVGRAGRGKRHQIKHKILWPGLVMGLGVQVALASLRGDYIAYITHKSASQGAPILSAHATTVVFFVISTAFLLVAAFFGHTVPDASRFEELVAHHRLRRREAHAAERRAFRRQVRAQHRFDRIDRRGWAMAAYTARRCAAQVSAGHAICAAFWRGVLKRWPRRIPRAPWIGAVPPDPETLAPEDLWPPKFAVTPIALVLPPNGRVRAEKAVVERLAPGSRS